MMAKLKLSFSSLHMVLQKSFLYADLVLKNNLLSMLKTVFVDTLFFRIL